MSIEDAISTQEAAERWGMSAENIKKLAQEGKIKAKKISGVWIVDKDQPNPKKYKLDK